MGFLDSTGLAYYTNKLKSIFVRTVNGQGPVGDQGNVEITQVPLAENLYNDEVTDNLSNFIYRISGGMADIESGDAALTTIKGLNKITDRIEESISFDNTNNINLTLKQDGIVTFRNAVNNQQGDYTFSYVATDFPNGSYENDWSSVGTWRFNSLPIDLNNFGLETGNSITAKGFNTSSSNTITSVSVNPYVFNTQFSESGNYRFNCQSYSAGEGQPITYKWYYQEDEINLGDYGISITGTYDDGSFVMVILQIGTPTSNCVVHFQPYVNGNYTFSTPETFVSTGFNQFNKNSSSFYLTNATIDSSTHTIVTAANNYVCYCKAAAGSPAGYVGYSKGGYITGIGWCKNVPTINTELSGTETTYDEDMGFSDDTKHRAIMFNENGYVAISVTNMSDLCIHIRWDKEEDNVFENYVEPDVIDFRHLRGTYEGTQQTLPISSYGLPAITVNNQIVTDILDLRTRTYTQSIERLENNETNMAIVVNSGQRYEYTNSYIYVVLSTPKSYINVETQVDEDTWEPINYIYEVNDLGTEEFTGTNVEVQVIQRYGENLRNKLKGNVLTISDQTDLTASQIASIRRNFLNIIYPVGSIYISTSSTSPQNIWGGVWAQIPGRFLLGVGSNVANTNTSWGSCAAGTVNRSVNEMGGEAYHTLSVSEMPSHTHTQNAHNHSMNNIWSNGSGGSSNAYTLSSTADKKLKTRYTTTVTPTNNNTGGGSKHNNMPPYYAVYMWRRTK